MVGRLDEELAEGIGDMLMAVVNRNSVDLVDDQVVIFTIQPPEIEHAGATGIAEVLAFFASVRIPQRCGCRELHHIEPFHIARAGRHLVPAMRAKPAYQSLRQNHAQHLGNVVVQQAPVAQRRHRADGIAAMHRAQEDASADRRVECAVRRHRIPDFAHHHVIGVQPENRLHCFREVNVMQLVNLDLRNAVNVILDRVFNGDNRAIGQL